MQRDLAITFIHVTDTQLEAVALADLVVVINDGNIERFIVLGKPLSLINYLQAASSRMSARPKR